MMSSNTESKWLLNEINSNLKRNGDKRSKRMKKHNNCQLIEVLQLSYVLFANEMQLYCSLF